MTEEVDQFWRSVAIGSGTECWPWRGKCTRDGYGSLWFMGESFAHRVVWLLTVGPIPEGKHVLHHCDNPPCCNPFHLFLGTPLANAQDREAKGRGRWRNQPPREPRVFRIRRPRTGSLVHRKDGRWQVSRFAEGKRRYWMFRTEAEAQLLLDKLVAGVEV